MDKRHVEVVRILLQHHAEIDLQDDVRLCCYSFLTAFRLIVTALCVQDGVTALMKAAEMGRVDIVALLLQHHASLELRDKVRTVDL